MKKLSFLLIILFSFSPILNASTSSEFEIVEIAPSLVCHSMAQAIADGSDTEGEEYTETYLEAYNLCENHMD